MIQFNKAKPGTYVWKKDDESFIVPEFKPMGLSKIAPSEMSKHFLGTGMSGSGKTESFIKPMTRSVLQYKHNSPEERSAVLLIDPKKDIKDEFADGGGIRKVYDINSKKYKIDIFEGMNKEALTGKDLIEYAGNFSDDLKNAQEGHSGSWYMSAKNLTELLLDCLINAYEKRCDIDTFFHEVLNIQTEKDNNTNIFSYVNKILDHSAEKKKQHDVFDRLTAFMSKSGKDFAVYANMNDATYSGILFSAQMFAAAACNKEINEFLHMNPYVPAENILSVNDVVENGDMIIFQPEETPVHNFIGRALKAKFFESTFSRDSVLRPVVYICDEFHRFITTDKNSGEQNYLDRCRAFRGICILACQSLSSIKEATAKNDSQSYNVDIIKENTSSKFFFFSQDPMVKNHLLNTIPKPPLNGLPHVVEIKLPSMLSTGECYCQHANKWFLSKIQLDPNRLEFDYTPVLGSDSTTMTDNSSNVFPDIFGNG